jgi:hypothetical protein
MCILTHHLLMKKLILLICCLLPLVSMAQRFTPTETARYQQQAKTVTIIKDNWGVPHIYGPTDAIQHQNTTPTRPVAMSTANLRHTILNGSCFKACGADVAPGR